MRAFEIDERDSHWERHDPRFRIYWFHGAGDAVTTVDIVDATIEHVLATASDQAHSNGFLWALASVENDESGDRGLVWLSGMDYNSRPSTQTEWARRMQMQRRYLLAQAAQGAPSTLPNGLRLIEMEALWTDGWPLWEIKELRHQLTGADLGLTLELSNALYEWNKVWQEHDELGPIPSGWESRGSELFIRLQAELEGVAEVAPPSFYSDGSSAAQTDLSG